MNELTKLINLVVNEELKRASAIYGERLASAHEAYSVILEEYEEAKDEVNTDLYIALTRFWNATKNDCANDQDAAEIRDAAVRAAAELVQVAAMATKAIRGYERSK